MLSTNEPEDELYRCDIPHSIFAKSAFSTQNQHAEQDRRDSAIDDFSVSRSLHLGAAGTIFLRREQAYSATTQPCINSATGPGSGINDDSGLPGISNAPGREPFCSPPNERVNFASDGERVFLRRRSVSTPPPITSNRKDSAISDINSSPVPPKGSVEPSRAGELSSECDRGTPESPGRPPSPLSEPPASPSFDSEAWVERKHIRADCQAIERARNVRIANEDAESDKRAVERASKASAVAKRRRLHLADTLQERGIALKQVHDSINSDEWPYTIPGLNRYLRERVREDVALFYAYMEQELELHQVMLGRLESIEEVGFLSERDLSEEQQYLLDQLEIRQADLQYGQDVWGHYLRQQTDEMKAKLANIPKLGDPQDTVLSQIANAQELCCSELEATVQQFPGLEAQVKEWQEFTYEIIARSKALEKELNKASTAQLAESDPELAVPDAIPQMTPGGRLIPIRQPLQPAYIDGWPEKWRKRLLGRPLTPPDELFLSTTVSIDGALSQEGNRPAPGSDASRFMSKIDSDSTDSSDDSSSDNSTDSDNGSTDKTKNVIPIRRTSQARQVLETVVEVPESIENNEPEAEDWSKTPQCPRLNATHARELDDGLSDYHRSLDLSPPKPEPSQLAESHMDPQRLVENVRPIPKIWRVPSLTPFLDCLSSRRQEPQPTSQSHLQIPHVSPAVVPRRPKGSAPMPGHNRPSSPPTQTPSPASRTSTVQPGTPINSPSPTLSNDVTDEGPVPSRRVARLERE
jgi:hypothetical protein